MAWGQVNRLGVGGNYVCCLAIVVIFIGLTRKSSYGRKLKGGSHKVKGRARMGERGCGGWALFMEELTTQVFYQSYLPISASFDLKRVLPCALHNIPSSENLISTR